MQEIESAWKSFFKQFVPYVFTEGEIIADENGDRVNDPDTELFPRITFSYSVTDILIDSLTTFQVWDWGTNSSRLLDICSRIAAAVPAGSGADITIPSKILYEYINPTSGEWLNFDLTHLPELMREFAPEPVEWRELPGEPAGVISIWRGSPFLTDSPKDEIMLRAKYGTLQSRHRAIK